jgi:hypothetical protein
MPVIYQDVAFKSRGQSASRFAVLVLPAPAAQLMSVTTTSKRAAFHAVGAASPALRACQDIFSRGVVDKSRVVMGGFSEKTMEDFEEMVNDLMVGIQGFQQVEVIDCSPPIALATFETPLQAMKVIRSQKKMPKLQEHRLWISENRSKTERFRCKVVSKLKKFLIELCGFAAKEVFASYKNFKVVVRHDGQNCADRIHPRERHCELDRQHGSQQRRPRCFGRIRGRTGVGKVCATNWSQTVGWEEGCQSKTRANK